MKKIIYALMLPLVVVSALVFANREIKSKIFKPLKPAPHAAAAMKAELEKWEASPDGIKFKEWEASPVGEKVLANAAQISKHLHASSQMEAVVTSLFLPPGSRLGFGVMARIHGEIYIVTFEPENSQLEQLRSLKVNDKIVLKGRSVSYAPKYSYPIVSADDVARNGRLIFKRIPRKGGC